MGRRNDVRFDEEFTAEKRSDAIDVSILGVDSSDGKAFAETNGFGNAFRDYEASDRRDVVAENYRQMHINQTVDFVHAKHKQWLNFTHGEYTVEEVIVMLDDLVDDSDPDVDIPNSIHDFQTAERIRAAYPDHDWFHLVGLLHDLGKIMAIWGEKQWSTVGDTYPVGCRFSPKIVHHKYFEECTDASHPVYSQECGIYKEKCGLPDLLMSWGHDEYMYWVLKENGCTIPQEGLDMIRFHSFYPWHSEGAYTHLTTEHDETVTKKWVLAFNKFDLYSKGDDIPDVKAVLPYYQGLMAKYNVAGKLRW